MPKGVIIPQRLAAQFCRMNRSAVCFSCPVEERTNQPQWQKSQQGGIIGQEHRAEHGDNHQRRTHAPDSGKGVYHPLGKSGKDMQIPQSTHHCQHTKQASKRLEVIIT